MKAATWFVAVSALALASCRTLGGYPLPAPVAAPAACSSVAANTPAAGLCGQISRISSFSAELHDAAVETQGAQVVFTGMVIGGALAGVGYNLFDAHADNVLAAAYIAASGLFLNNQLTPAQRSDIFLGTQLTLDCLNDRAAVFLLAHLGASGETPYDQLSKSYSDLGRLLPLARDAAAYLDEPIAAAGDDAADLRAQQAELQSLITQAEAMSVSLLGAREIIEDFPGDLSGYESRAVTAFNDKMRSQRIDLNAVLTAAQDIALRNASAGTGAEPGDADDKSDPPGLERDDRQPADVIRDLGEALNNAALLRPAQYRAQSDAAARCLAALAG